MTYPTVFANVTTNQPGSVLDTMFNIAGQQGNIPCTATGTNAITLTPGANFFVPAAYSESMLFSFTAAATSTGNVNLRVGGLGFFPVYVPAVTATQAAAGNIVINEPYLVQFTTAPNYNGGGGAFVIRNGITATAVAGPVGGSYRKLRLVTSSNTTLTPTVSDAILFNSGGGTARVTNVAPSVTSTASVGTPNGIVAAVAPSTFYAFWFIYNPNLALSLTNPAGWLDTNFTTPTPPAGYTYFWRAGAFLTNGASNLHRIIQVGNRAQYVVTPGTATTALPQMVTGVAGTDPTIPTWGAISTAAFVPSTASDIRLVLWVIAAAGAAVIAAPNANYGVDTSTANPAPLQATHTGGATTNTIIGEFTLESVNVFYASNTGASGMSCLGWIDNI